MFEGWLASLLKRVLEAWVEPESLGNLEMSLWSGYAKLTNLRIKRTVLDGLGLPVRLVRGHIGQITVQVPWGVRFGERPAEITIDNVLLLVRTDLGWAGGSREKVAATALRSKLARVAGWEELVAARRQHSLHLHAAAVAAGGTTPLPSPSGVWASQIDASLEAAAAVAPGFVEKLATALVEGVVLSVRNFHLRWEDHQSLPGHRMSVGVTMASLTFASPRVARATAAGKAVSLRGAPLGVGGSGMAAGGGGGSRSVLSGGIGGGASATGGGGGGALSAAANVATAVAGGVGWGLGVLRQWWQGGAADGEAGDADGEDGSEGFGYPGEEDDAEDGSGGDEDDDVGASFRGHGGAGSLVQSQRAQQHRRRRRRRRTPGDRLAVGDDDSDGGSVSSCTTGASSEGSGHNAPAPADGVHGSNTVPPPPAPAASTLFGFSLPWWPGSTGTAAPAPTTSPLPLPTVSRPRQRLLRKGLHIGRIAVYVHVEGQPGAGREQSAWAADAAAQPIRISMVRPPALRTTTLTSLPRGPPSTPLMLVDLAVCPHADFVAGMDALIPRDSDSITPPLTCAAAVQELQRLRSLPPPRGAAAPTPETMHVDPATTTSPMFRLPSSLQLGDHPARHFFVMAPTDLLVTGVVNRNPRSTSAPQLSLRVVAPVLHVQLLAVQYAAVLAVTAAWSGAKVRQQYEWWRPLSRVLPPPIVRPPVGGAVRTVADLATAAPLRRSLASLWWLYALRVTLKQLQAGWLTAGLLTWRQVQGRVVIRRALVHLLTRNLVAQHTHAPMDTAPAWSIHQTRALARYLSRDEALARGEADDSLALPPSRSTLPHGRVGGPARGGASAGDVDGVRRRRRPDQPSWLAARAGSAAPSLGWRRGRGIRHKVDGLFVDDEDDVDAVSGHGDTRGGGGGRVVRPSDVLPQPRVHTCIAVSAPPPSSPSSGADGGASDTSRDRVDRRPGGRALLVTVAAHGGAAASTPATGGASRASREGAVLARLRSRELVQLVEATVSPDVTQSPWRRWARRWMALQARRRRLVAESTAEPATGDGERSPVRAAPTPTPTPGTPASREAAPSSAAEPGTPPATPSTATLAAAARSGPPPPTRLTMTPGSQLAALDDEIRRMCAAGKWHWAGSATSGGRASAVTVPTAPLNEHESVLLSLLQAELSEDDLKVLGAVAREQAAAILAPPSEHGDGAVSGSIPGAAGLGTNTSLDSWAASLDDSTLTPTVPETADVGATAAPRDDTGLMLEGDAAGETTRRSPSSHSRSTSPSTTDGSTTSVSTSGQQHAGGTGPRGGFDNVASFDRPLQASHSRLGGSRLSERGSWLSGRDSSLVAGSAEGLERAQGGRNGGGGAWFDFGWLWQRPSVAAGVADLPNVVTPATLAGASTTVTNLMKLDAQWEAKRREMFADLDYDPTITLEPYPRAYAVLAVHVSVRAASLTLSNMLSPRPAGTLSVPGSVHGVHAFQLHGAGVSISTASRVGSGRVEVALEHALATHAAFLPHSVVITRLMASQPPEAVDVVSPGRVADRARAHTAGTAAAASAAGSWAGPEHHPPPAVPSSAVGGSGRGTTAAASVAHELESTRSGRGLAGGGAGVGEAMSVRSRPRSRRAAATTAAVRGMASPAGTARSGRLAGGDEGGDVDPTVSGFLLVIVDTLPTDIARSAADVKLGEAIRDTDLTDGDPRAVGRPPAVAVVVSPAGEGDTAALVSTPVAGSSVVTTPAAPPSLAARRPREDTGRLWVVARGDGGRPRRRLGGAVLAASSAASDHTSAARALVDAIGGADEPGLVARVDRGGSVTTRATATRLHTATRVGERPPVAAAEAADDAPGASLAHRRGQWATGADVTLSCSLGAVWVHAAPASLHAMQYSFSVVSAGPAAALPTTTTTPAPRSDAVPAPGDPYGSTDSGDGTDIGALFSDVDGDAVRRAQASVQRRLARLGGGWFGHMADALSSRRALGLNVRLDQVTATVPVTIAPVRTAEQGDRGGQPRAIAAVVQVVIVALRARSDKLQSRWSAASSLAAMAATDSAAALDHLADALYDRFRVRVGACAASLVCPDMAPPPAGIPSHLELLAVPALKGDVSLSIAPTLPLLARVRLGAAVPSLHMHLHPALATLTVVGMGPAAVQQPMRPSRPMAHGGSDPPTVMHVHQGVGQGDGGTDLSGFEDAVSDTAPAGGAAHDHVDVSARHLLHSDDSLSGGAEGPVDAQLMQAAVAIGLCTVVYNIGFAPSHADGAMGSLEVRVHNFTSTTALTTNSAQASLELGGVTMDALPDGAPGRVSLLTVEPNPDSIAAVTLSLSRRSAWAPREYRPASRLLHAATRLSPSVLGVPLPQVHTTLSCVVGAATATCSEPALRIVQALQRTDAASSADVDEPVAPTSAVLTDAAPMSTVAVVTNTVALALSWGRVSATLQPTPATPAWRITVGRGSVDTQTALLCVVDTDAVVSRAAAPSGHGASARAETAPPARTVVQSSLGLGPAEGYASYTDLPITAVRMVVGSPSMHGRHRWGEPAHPASPLVAAMQAAGSGGGGGGGGGGGWTDGYSSAHAGMRSPRPSAAAGDVPGTPVSVTARLLRGRSVGPSLPRTAAGSGSDSNPAARTWMSYSFSVPVAVPRSSAGARRPHTPKSSMLSAAALTAAAVSDLDIGTADGSTGTTSAAARASLRVASRPSGATAAGVALARSLEQARGPPVAVAMLHTTVAIPLRYSAPVRRVQIVCADVAFEQAEPTTAQPLVYTATDTSDPLLDAIVWHVPVLPLHPLTPHPTLHATSLDSHSSTPDDELLAPPLLRACNDSGVMAVMVDDLVDGCNSVTVATITTQGGRVAISPGAVDAIWQAAAAFRTHAATVHAALPAPVVAPAPMLPLLPGGMVIAASLRDWSFAVSAEPGGSDGPVLVASTGLWRATLEGVRERSARFAMTDCSVSVVDDRDRFTFTTLSGMGAVSQSASDGMRAVSVEVASQPLRARLQAHALERACRIAAAWAHHFSSTLQSDPVPAAPPVVDAPARPLRLSASVPEVAVELGDSVSVHLDGVSLAAVVENVDGIQHRRSQVVVAAVRISSAHAGDASVDVVRTVRPVLDEEADAAHLPWRPTVFVSLDAVMGDPPTAGTQGTRAQVQDVTVIVTPTFIRALFHDLGSLAQALSPLPVPSPSARLPHAARQPVHHTLQLDWVRPSITLMAATHSFSPFLARVTAASVQVSQQSQRERDPAQTEQRALRVSVADLAAEVGSSGGGAAFEPSVLVTRMPVLEPVAMTLAVDTRSPAGSAAVHVEAGVITAHASPALFVVASAMHEQLVDAVTASTAPQPTVASSPTSAGGQDQLPTGQSGGRLRAAFTAPQISLRVHHHAIDEDGGLMLAPSSGHFCLSVRQVGASVRRAVTGTASGTSSPTSRRRPLSPLTAELSGETAVMVAAHGVVDATWHGGARWQHGPLSMPSLQLIHAVGASLHWSPAAKPAMPALTISLDRPLVISASRRCLQSGAALWDSATRNAAWQPAVGVALWDATAADAEPVGGSRAPAPLVHMDHLPAVAGTSTTALCVTGAVPASAVHTAAAVLWLAAPLTATTLDGANLPLGRARFLRQDQRLALLIAGGGGVATVDLDSDTGSSGAHALRHSELLRRHSDVHVWQAPAPARAGAEGTGVHCARVSGPLVAAILNESCPPPRTSGSVTWPADLSGVTLVALAHSAYLINGCDYDATVYCGDGDAINAAAGGAASLPAPWVPARVPTNAASPDPAWHVRIAHLSLRTAAAGAQLRATAAVHAGLLDAASWHVRQHGWPSTLLHLPSAWMCWLPLADARGHTAVLAVVCLPTLLDTVCVVLLPPRQIRNETGVRLGAVQALQLHQATTQPAVDAETWVGRAMRSLLDEGGVLEDRRPVVGANEDDDGSRTVTHRPHPLPTWLRVLVGGRIPSPERDALRSSGVTARYVPPPPAPMLPPGVPPSAAAVVAMASRGGKARAIAAHHHSASEKASWLVGPVTLDELLVDGRGWDRGWSLRMRSRGCIGDATWTGVPATGCTGAVPAPRRASPAAAGVSAEWRPTYRFTATTVHPCTVALHPALRVRHCAPAEWVVCLLVEGVVPLGPLAASAGDDTTATATVTVTCSVAADGHMASGSAQPACVMTWPAHARAHGRGPCGHVLVLPPGVVAPLHSGFLGPGADSSGVPVRACIVFAPSVASVVTSLGMGTEGVALAARHPSSPCVLENVPSQLLHRWVARPDVIRTPWAAWSVVAAACSQPARLDAAITFPCSGGLQWVGALRVAAVDSSAPTTADVVLCRQEGCWPAALAVTPRHCCLVGAAYIVNNSSHPLVAAWRRPAKWSVSHADTDDAGLWTMSLPAGGRGVLAGGVLCEASCILLTWQPGRTTAIALPAEGQVRLTPALQYRAWVDGDGLQHVVVDSEAVVPTTHGHAAPPAAQVLVSAPSLHLRLFDDASGAMQPVASIAATTIVVRLGRQPDIAGVGDNALHFGAAAWVDHLAGASVVTLDGGDGSLASKLAAQELHEVRTTETAPLSEEGSDTTLPADVAAAAERSRDSSTPTEPGCHLSWSAVDVRDGPATGCSHRRVELGIAAARVAVSVPNVVAASASMADIVGSSQTSGTHNAVADDADGNAQTRAAPVTIARAVTSQAVLALQLSADGAVTRIPLPGLRMDTPTPLVPWSPWWRDLLGRSRVASPGDVAHVAWQGMLSAATMIASRAGLLQDSTRLQFHASRADSAAPLPADVRWGHISSPVVPVHVSIRHHAAGEGYSEQRWCLQLSHDPHSSGAITTAFPATIHLSSVLGAQLRLPETEVCLTIAHSAVPRTVAATAYAAAVSSSPGVSGVMLPRDLVLRFHHPDDWHKFVAALPRRLRRPHATAAVVAWSTAGSLAGSVGVVDVSGDGDEGARQGDGAAGGV